MLAQSPYQPQRRLRLRSGLRADPGLALAFREQTGRDFSTLNSYLSVFQINRFSNHVSKSSTAPRTPFNQCAYQDLRAARARGVVTLTPPGKTQRQL